MLEQPGFESIFCISARFVILLKFGGGGGAAIVSPRISRRRRGTKCRCQVKRRIKGQSRIPTWCHSQDHALKSVITQVNWANSAIVVNSPTMNEKLGLRFTKNAVDLPTYDRPILYESISSRTDFRGFWGTETGYPRVLTDFSTEINPIYGFSVDPRICGIPERF